MLERVFRYLGPDLCHTQLFLLNEEAEEAYKVVERYVKMGWIRDKVVPGVPRGILDGISGGRTSFETGFKQIRKVEGIGC